MSSRICQVMVVPSQPTMKSWPSALDTVSQRAVAGREAAHQSSSFHAALSMTSGEAAMV